MSVRVIGLDKAIKDLRKKGKDAEQTIKNVLEDTASEIEFQAKTDAPSRIGDILINVKQRIDKVPSNKGFTWKIGIQGTQDFDAYVEFGTGLSAKQILGGKGYTQEMRDIAFQFYKNGQGTLRGQPFLFPAWIRYTTNLVKELKEEIAMNIK